MTDHLLVCFFAILSFGKGICAESNYLDLDVMLDDNGEPKSIPEDWKITTKSRVSHITARNVNVETIRSNAFQGFDNLRRLKMSGVIGGIEENAFAGLMNLNHLSLSGCSIQDIGQNVFKNLPMLEEVLLEHNNISELSGDSFINLPKLLHIDLSHNKINTIKSWTFAGCPNLTSLYLYNNEVSNIEPEAFSNLYYLNVLGLWSNLLKTITESYFQGLTNLKTLDLSLNAINEIDGTSFRDLSKLIRLDLSVNNISSLDQFLLVNLTELNEVKFSHNAITSLPDGFFNSTRKLKWISIKYNSLKEFHLHNDLVNLTLVDLQHNQIESIKLSAATQRNIRQLRLSDNNLTRLNESFQHLINLEQLSLGNNKLKSFPLCIPGNLGLLDLSQNELHEIALDNFCGSATQGMLKYIYLSSNRFTSFNFTHSNKSFQETHPFLYELDLGNNFLSDDIVNLILHTNLPHKLIYRLDLQRKVEVRVSCNESTYRELDQNGDGTNHGDETTIGGTTVKNTDQNEKQNISWAALYLAGSTGYGFAADVIGDCSDLDSTESGVYVIQPSWFDSAFTAYCDMEVDFSKWTVIQCRFNGSLDFHRDFQTYADGFGQVSNEFWIGLERLHQLTKDNQHELYIEITPFEGSKKFARFSEFNIGSKDEGYKLHVQGYSGDAGDSLSRHNGKRFSTYDKEEDDSNGNNNCIDKYRNGWWFGSCEYSNLNAKYYSVSTKDYTSMHWETAFKQWSLKESRMMIAKRKSGALHQSG